MSRALAFVAVVALTGCGGEPDASREAFTAIVAASDQAEERLCMPLEAEERRGCLECIRAATDEALRRIDPEAADELH